MESKKNETVMITGGSMGIGYELAKIFAKNGYKLILISRSENNLEEVKDELMSTHGVTVETLAVDLFNADAAFSLYDEIKRRGWQVDILVNDAGQGQYGLFTETDIHRQLDIIQLNISSLTVLTYLYIKEMVTRGSGKVLQVASVASELPGPYQAVYHATKAYVLSFTEALISELKDSGVTMTALQPGATNTDFFRKADMLDSKAVQDKSKLSHPADVAQDGYDALMRGDDKVVSGFKNKIQVAMSNILPDTTVADKLKKQQEPIETSDKTKAS